MSNKRMPKTEQTVESVSPVEPEIIIPLTLDQIIADLKGFGIEDTDAPIVITASGKTVSLKLANIPTEDELATLLATEEYKGHAWIARVKGEILSRSISSINGLKLSEHKDNIINDLTTGEEVLLQTALRNMVMGWGQEVVNVLWKILMVHCQRLEDRLFESLPDSQIMTEVEKRFIQQAMQEISESQTQVYREAAKEMLLSE